MEKYNIIVKIEEIKRLTENGEIERAVKAADSIEYERLRTVSDLSVIGEAFIRGKEYSKARMVYERLYERTRSRRVVMQLVNLAIKLKDIEGAEEYLQDFVDIAPEDFYRYIFRYSIDKLRGEPYKTLIDSLERLKKKEYIEKWAYELAKLYHKAGLDQKCVDECSDIILWFGEGQYVERAKALRSYYYGELDLGWMEESKLAETRPIPPINITPPKEPVPVSKPEKAEPEKDERFEKKMTGGYVSPIDGRRLTSTRGMGSIVAFRPEGQSSNSAPAREITEFEEEPLPADGESAPAAEEPEKVNPEEGSVKGVSEAEESIKEVSHEEENIEEVSEASVNAEEPEEEADTAAIETEDFDAESNDPTAIAPAESNAEPDSQELPDADNEITPQMEMLREALADQGLSYDSLFGIYSHIPGIEKQIADVLVDTVTGEAVQYNYLIVGEKGTGKTALAKNISKYLFKTGCIATPKVALISAEKLNHINLVQKKESLTDCCLIVEGAGELNTSSAAGLAHMIRTFNGRIAVMLEDSRENMTRLAQERESLIQMFQAPICLPAYTPDSLVEAVCGIVEEKDYHLLAGAKEALVKKVKECFAKGGEINMKTATAIAGAAIERAERRNEQELLKFAESGKLDQVDLEGIAAEDFA